MVQSIMTRQQMVERLKDGDILILIWKALLYKAGWIKHPSTMWLFESAYNYIWLYKHMIALNDEYKKRYNHTKNHVTIDKLGEILKHPPKNAKYNKIATDPKTMPEYCKIPVTQCGSYRKYYIMEKRRFATWKSPSKNTRMVHRRSETCVKND